MYSESPFNNTKQSDKTQTLKNFFGQNECVFVGRRGWGGGERFCFAVIKFYIFIQQKSTDSLTLKRHNSFQNYNIRNATHTFVPRPLAFKW